MVFLHISVIPQPSPVTCRWNEGPNDRREGAGGAVDHPRAPAEGAADETHDPRRVESDGGLDVGHEGEGNLGFLVKFGEFWWILVNFDGKFWWCIYSGSMNLYCGSIL